MKKILILLAYLFLISVNACFASVYNYPAKLESISKALPELSDIKCKFQQEKYLQNVSKPLVSNGNFEFVKNEGIHFYTTYPIKSTVDYTNSDYKQINQIINAISEKRYSKIEKEFSFYFETQKEVWTLGIKPKPNSTASNYISHITISGKDYITMLEIKQTNGNKTIIRFTK